VSVGIGIAARASAILVAAIAVARLGLSGLKGRFGAKYRVTKHSSVRMARPTIMATSTVAKLSSDRFIELLPKNNLVGDKLTAYPTNWTITN
jgi:hypothetical protein